MARSRHVERMGSVMTRVVEQLTRRLMMNGESFCNLSVLHSRHCRGNAFHRSWR